MTVYARTIAGFKGGFFFGSPRPRQAESAYAGLHCRVGLDSVARAFVVFRQAVSVAVQFVA